MAALISSPTKPAPENLVQLITQAQDSLSKVLAELKTRSGFTLEIMEDTDILQCSLTNTDLFEEDEPTTSSANDHPSSVMDADRSSPQVLPSSGSRKRSRSDDDRLSAKLAVAFELAPPPPPPSTASEYVARDIKFVKARSVVASSKLSFRPTSFGSFINSVMAAVPKVGETSSDSPVIITSNGPKKAKDFTKNDIRDLAEDNGPIVCVLQQPSSSSSSTSLSHPQRDVRQRGSRSPPRKDGRRR